MRKNLTSDERIRRREDIKQLFASSWFKTSGSKLFYRKNDLNITRILIVPGRHYGNAVGRNYIKREGKEIFRNFKCEVKPGYDVAIVFYPGSYSYEDRVTQMTWLLDKSTLRIAAVQDSPEPGTSGSGN